VYFEALTIYITAPPQVKPQLAIAQFAKWLAILASKNDGWLPLRPGASPDHHNGAAKKRQCTGAHCRVNLRNIYSHPGERDMRGDQSNGKDSKYAANKIFHNNKPLHFLVF